MPIYCYSDDDGNIVERVYPMGKQPGKIKVGKRTYSRDLAADQREFVATPSTTGAFLCHAMGVHPSQVAEANADLRAKKLDRKARYRRDGILEVADHRDSYRKVMLELGHYHRNAGYSDVTKDDLKQYRERRGIPPR